MAAKPLHRVKQQGAPPWAVRCLALPARGRNNGLCRWQRPERSLKTEQRRTGQPARTTVRLESLRTVDVARRSASE